MPRYVAAPSPPEYTDAEMIERATAFNDLLQRRRTIRHFSDRPVPREVIEQALRAAGSAPSGAHRQPWHFVVITEPALKARLREEAERAERHFYSHAPEEWLKALEPLGTDDQKPYLETAPYIIAIFAERYGLAGTGERSHNYYVMESVGIATGMLISALHAAGLATLTHTPSPMGFLSHVLKRPDSEKPYLLLVAGYPAEGAMVPDIRRKPLADFVTWR